MGFRDGLLERGYGDPILGEGFEKGDKKWVKGEEIG